MENNISALEGDENWIQYSECEACSASSSTTVVRVVGMEDAREQGNDTENNDIAQPEDL